jgi:glycosyltransferase involved in cell wall biosynthesis
MNSRTICIMGRLLDQDDGLGVYSSNLLRNLFDLDRDSRYLVLLRTNKCAGLFESYPNVQTRVISSRSKLWWDQVSVPRAARRAGADIIFNPKFSLPLLSRIPGVFVLHGSDWYINPGNYTWWDNIYIRIMMPIYIRKAARLLSISQVAIDDLVKYAGLDPRKVSPSYGAAGAHFRAIKDPKSLREFAERYRLPEHFILTVGRVYHTGHDRLDEYPGGNNERLILGFRLYRERGGKLPLVVVGRDIEKYLRSHGFDDAALKGVHFTGFIPNVEIVNVYNLAEFFVLATLYESFPLPLIEAMACGCPAMVPKTGGCPELAQGAARLIDPLDVRSIAEGMLALDRSPDLRAQMRAAGLERAGRFSWRRTAEVTLRVLDEVAPRVKAGVVAKASI